MKHIIIMIIVVFTLTSCARTQPIYNVEEQAIVASVSSEQVEESIIAALTHKGWKIIEQSPGKINAFIDVRGKHNAEIQIAYTTSNFSINYVNSGNLKYGTNRKKQTVIHRNYNKWITLLNNEIRMNLSKH